MVTGDTAEDRGEIRSPRALFTQRFTDLYAAAGNPTLRRVAAAADARMRAARGNSASPASAQRISDWKTGRNVPARFESLLPVVLTLIDLAKKSGKPTSALFDLPEWQRLWQASISWTAEDEDDTACPYPGLKSYRRQDKDRFFGRTRSTAELTELVRDTSDIAGGIVTLIGASGAGKSSLLAAGLVPTLTQPPHKWSAVIMTPGATPLAALAKAVAAENARTAEQPDLEQTPSPTAALDLWPAEQHRLLIVDQFEELFTTCSDEHERDAFLSLVETCATRKNNPVAVVIALRADFYAHCLDYPVLQESLERRSYLLGPMRIDELAQAITGPTEPASLKLESGLEELVITELCGLGDHANRQSYDPGALPLLSHVMAATWQHREGRRLTVAGYRKAGGVVGSVAATAEQAWSELSDAQQTMAKELLLGLVTVGHDSHDTRRTASRPELLQRVADNDAATTALELLAHTRLITLDADSVYFSHEIVLTAWPRLRAWIDEDRVGYLVRQRLESDAVEWDTAGRDSSLLYRGTRLETALGNADPPGGPARSFLDASRAARTTSRRRSSAAKVGLALLGVVLLVLGIAAYAQTQFGEQQRDDKHLAIVLNEADRLQSTDPSLAAQLYLVANQIRPHDPNVRARLLRTQSMALAASLVGHTQAIRQVAYRKDGKVLASVGADNTVRLWDTVDYRELGQAFDDGAGSIESVTISSDGLTMVTAVTTGAPRLWDISQPVAPKLIGSLPTNDKVSRVVFGPTGRTMATMARSQHVTLWDLGNRAEPKPGPVLPVPPGHQVSSLAFSPDGRLVGVGSSNKHANSVDQRAEVHLWNVAEGSAPTAIEPFIHADASGAEEIAFSADGSLLAVAGNPSPRIGGVVQLWDIKRSNEPRPRGQPFEATGNLGIRALAFSPNGPILATGGFEDAKLWNLVNPTAPALLGGAGLSVSPTVCRYVKTIEMPCAGGPSTLDFSPDGRGLATGASDGKVRLWSLPQFIARDAQIFSEPLFSDDGKRMVTCDGSRIDIWDTRNPRDPRRIGQLELGFTPSGGPKLSPDGLTLVVWQSGSEPIRIFDLSDPAKARPAGEFPLPRDPYSDLYFSPDWRLLLTRTGGGWADNGGLVDIWDVSNLWQPIRLSSRISLGNVLIDMTFGPDGRTVVAWAVYPDENGRIPPIKLWDITNPAQPIRRGDLPNLPQGPVVGLLFHPDKHRMIALGYQAMQSLDISDPAKAVVIADPIAVDNLDISSFDLDPYGRTVVTSGENASVRLWDFSAPARPKPMGPSVVPPGIDYSNLRFTPDGEHLSGTADDGTLRFLDLDEQHAIDRVCNTTRGLLTPELWRQHLPELSYRPPCD
ncbi:NACHT and WD repeat domain-containing protein [Nocardia sp. GCM10030253]|uniref:NACHT and WD repeat domain-containing protein n=1 Tax=Nocardia sp. GCM10030253 TaxID=3273404 RepID=UPI003631E649